VTRNNQFNGRLGFLFFQCSSHSPGASARQRGRQRRPAGDEGGGEEDGPGEEGDHPGAVPLAGVPPAPGHRHRAAALPAAVWHQRGE